MLWYSGMLRIRQDKNIRELDKTLRRQKAALEKIAALDPGKGAAYNAERKFFKAKRIAKKALGC